MDVEITVACQLGTTKATVIAERMPLCLFKCVS